MAIVTISGPNWGNIRLHDDAVAMQSEFIAIFSRIANTPTGASLFNTLRFLANGLDVYLTTGGSKGGGNLFENSILINPSNAPSDETAFIDQNGNIKQYDLDRLVLHEFIHASVRVFDLGNDDTLPLFLAEFGKADPQFQNAHLDLENAIAREMGYENSDRMAYPSVSGVTNGESFC